MQLLRGTGQCKGEKERRSGRVQAELRKEQSRQYELFKEYESIPGRGGLLGERQKENPALPKDPNSKAGFVQVPAGYLPEFADYGIFVRGDVRMCICLVAGDVVENLLFFPVLEQLRRRYPGVIVDIFANERGKQAYELNWIVRRTNVVPFGDEMLVGAEYADFVGKMKNIYAELIVSTRPAGMGHAVTLGFSDARMQLGYVLPGVNGVGAEKLLTNPIRAPVADISTRGVRMYSEMLEILDAPPGVIPDVRIAISDTLREVATYKQGKAGVEKGGYLLAHGLQSESKATMAPRGDKDSLLDLPHWAAILQQVSSRVLFLVPREKDVAPAKAALPANVAVLWISTPGQVAVLIDESAGVLTTNTAALQLAVAVKKPSVALFATSEKAEAFAPDPEARKVTVVVSKTGRLADVDVAQVAEAVKSLANQPQLALV
jgi:ADP-heptose:LPS heptosyltransferase